MRSNIDVEKVSFLIFPLITLAIVTSIYPKKPNTEQVGAPNPLPAE